MNTKSVTKTEELRPCPFCGTLPQANTWTLHGISETRYFCPNPECPLSVRTVTLEEWQTRPIEDELRKRIAELEAERDQAKAAITRLRDYLYDYTNLHISVRQEDRWWALVDKFDELTKELQS
jgi:hypothetical protein